MASLKNQASLDSQAINMVEYRKQLAKELHKPVRKVKNTLKVVVPSKDYTWAMDLVDMGKFSKENDNHKFIITVVDIFTRYAWARPIKSKNKTDVLKAFQDIVADANNVNHSKPQKIWADEGLEFLNSLMAEYLKKQNIVIYATHTGNNKSTIVERFNRSLRELMVKRFTAEATTRYIEMLPELVETYNNRKHTTLKMSPMEASESKNESKIKKIMWPMPTAQESKQGLARQATFDAGDKVRISVQHKLFTKRSMADKWTKAIYEITEVNKPANPKEPITYKLMDIRKEPLIGKFYNEELQKVDDSIKDIHIIDKVLAKKTVKGIKMMKVTWQNAPPGQYNWIPESDLV